MHSNVCSVKFDLINFSSAIVRLLFKIGILIPVLAFFGPFVPIYCIFLPLSCKLMFYVVTKEEYTNYMS